MERNLLDDNEKEIREILPVVVKRLDQLRNWGVSGHSTLEEEWNLIALLLAKAAALAGDVADEQKGGLA